MMSKISVDIKQEKPLFCLRDLSNYRDNSMPESPESKASLTHTNSSALSPISSMPPITSRPLSTNSSISGMNGALSPHASLNGRTPSPPSLSVAASALSQQLPPACGARQLSKLKRFLTTLQQFGSDISPEIGERVRSLVLGLVNSHLSIEEFHAKLQEATNFPLRPFVIPFLKANLPLLQRELVHCARLAKQTPQQYLAQNDHLLFDPSQSPIDTQDLNNMDFNENGKRKSPDRPKENGVDPHMDVMHPSKRPHTVSPAGPQRVSPGSTHPFSFPQPPVPPMRLEEMSMNRDMRERERMERERMEREQRDRERPFSTTSYSNLSRNEYFENLDRLEEDWRQVENMLHCIVGMVDKCKRALVSLQERSHRDREEVSLWMRRHAETLDTEMKKKLDMLTSMRSPEDRTLLEAKRRAVCAFPEEAVNEVKRQAVVELQKAMATAESKASEMVSIERSKLDRAVMDARKQAQEDLMMKLNQQEESSESCWNCGRKASETCSGCNVARYCGSYCQHKDWENHHRVCGQGLASSRIQETRHTVGHSRAVDRTPPGTTPVQQHQQPHPLQQPSSSQAPPTTSATVTMATIRDTESRHSPTPPVRSSPPPPVPQSPGSQSSSNHGNPTATAMTTSTSGSRSNSPTDTKEVPAVTR